MCLSDQWSFACKVLAWGSRFHNSNYTHITFSRSLSVANIFNAGGPTWPRSAQRRQADMFSWHLLRRRSAAFSVMVLITLTSIWNAWLNCFTRACGKCLTLRMSPIWLTYKCNKSDTRSLEREGHFVSSCVLEATLNLGLVIELVLCDTQLFWLLKQLPCGH